MNIEKEENGTKQKMKDYKRHSGGEQNERSGTTSDPTRSTVFEELLNI